MKHNCKDEECQEDWNEENPECLVCGVLNYRNCPNYIQDSEEEIMKPETTLENTMLPFPWEGTAMGRKDIEQIHSQQQPIIIGVIGHANAGKTTLLAVLYMLLRGGNRIGNYQFAGSNTLLGWETLAHFLTFNTHKKLLFPPHTSRNLMRVPGLLHLLLKDEHGRFQDVIFTDSPGEWFKDWAISADIEESKGARWIDENADAFILVADCEAFKKNIGKTRLALMQIVERMKNTYENRPTALVWMKSDVAIHEDVEKSNSYKKELTTKIQKHLSDVQSYDVSVMNHKDNDFLNNILVLTNQLLIENHHKSNTIPFIDIKNKQDFFFNFRKLWQNKTQ